MSPFVIELIGILASFTILVALLMPNIKHLRIINGIGATVFIFYGVIIESYATIILSTGSVLVNIYFLVKMFLHKPVFKIVLVDKNHTLLEQYLNVGRLGKLRPFLDNDNYLIYLLITDLHISGIYVLEKSDTKLNLIYKVTPQHKRDVAQATYVLRALNKILDSYYNQIEVITPNRKIDRKFYTKLRFELTEEGESLHFIKNREY